MGFLKGLFGGNSEGGSGADPKAGKGKKVIPWIPLTEISQLKDIQEKSKSKTQVIFKHSTTCGISRMVMNMFNSSYDLSLEQVDLYYLDLHAHRDVSNETGYTFQVIHQSPQLLVIRNETTVAHASHGAISEVDLLEYV